MSSPNLTKCLHSRCQEEGSCYIVNASSWLGPLDVVQPIYGYLMPVLMCITFFSNSVIIIVLSRFCIFLLLHYNQLTNNDQAQHELPHQHRPAVHGRVWSPHHHFTSTLVGKYHIYLSNWQGSSTRNVFSQRILSSSSIFSSKAISSTDVHQVCVCWDFVQPCFLCSDWYLYQKCRVYPFLFIFHH